MWRGIPLAMAVLVTNIFARQPMLEPEHGRDSLRVTVSAQGLVPLEHVLSMLRKRYSGEQLDAQVKRNPPDVVLYEIQWLTREGRKIVFIVNARDGRIVATRGLEADANPGR